jgi:uncharacterized cupin superfamily protein
LAKLARNGWAASDPLCGDRPERTCDDLREEASEQQRDHMGIAGFSTEESRLLVMEATPEQAKAYKLAAEKIVAGAPAFVSWDLEKSADGKVTSGIWEATPGAWRSAKGSDWEFCHLISGVVELTEDGKPPVVLKAGDSFTLRPGFIGIWRVIEPVRKSFVIYSA